MTPPPAGTCGALTKLEPAGASVVFSTYTMYRLVMDVKFAASGAVWVLEGNGLSQYSANGTAWPLFRQIIPVIINVGNMTLAACCVDAAGDVYVTGSTSKT